MKIRIQSYFILASGVLIILIGIISLIFKLLERNEKIKNSFEDKSILAVAFSAGIVPCPAALMLILLTLSRGNGILGLFP